MEIVVLSILILLLLFAILGNKKPAIAMIAMPIVCLLLVYAAIWYDVFDAIAIAPAVFVVTLLAVLTSKREPGYEGWPQKLAKCILISLGCLVLLAALLILIAWGGYGALLFAFFMVAVGRFGLISRDATALYIISTIGSSMRQNLPLPMALESAAAGRADKRSQILQRIKKWLVQGYSLSESIKRGYPKCPGFAVAMIAASEQIDQLPLAMASIEADMLAKADEKRKLRPVHPLYPVVVVTFVCFIVWALMTFVTPTFSSVLAEMVEGLWLFLLRFGLSFGLADQKSRTCFHEWVILLSGICPCCIGLRRTIR